MKAIQINKYGSSEVIELNDIPEPTLKDGQVLVKVQAASLNPFDAKIRNGALGDKVQFPMTLGGDFAGVVEETGEEVYGQAIVLNGGSGAFAQLASANLTHISPKPKNVSYEEAAAAVLVGISAIQALEEHINLQKDQKILIHGGAGGIGSTAVQLAKHLGAYVAATASRDDEDFVKGLGADQVIDYKSEKFEDLLKDFDAVYDTVGGQVTDKSFQVLKKGGVLVSMMGQPNEELAKEHEVTAIGESTEVNNQRLAHLTEQIEQEAIKPQVDKVFPLEQAKEAFDYLEKDSPKGKVVLKI